MAVISSSIEALEEQHLDRVNLGQHVLAEFFECDSNILNNIDKVEKFMIDAALECGATIVQKCFHNVFIQLTIPRITRGIVPVFFLCMLKLTLLFLPYRP